jgi:hypothetical protein
MGFVIQMAPGKAEARAVVPGVPGRADNAARGHLGANTAVKIRGTRPSIRRPSPWLVWLVLLP